MLALRTLARAPAHRVWGAALPPLATSPSLSLSDRRRFATPPPPQPHATPTDGGAGGLPRATPVNTTGGGGGGDGRNTPPPTTATTTALTALSLTHGAVAASLLAAPATVAAVSLAPAALPLGGLTSLEPLARALGGAHALSAAALWALRDGSERRVLATPPLRSLAAGVGAASAVALASAAVSFDALTLTGASALLAAHGATLATVLASWPADLPDDVAAAERATARARAATAGGRLGPPPALLSAVSLAAAGVGAAYLLAPSITLAAVVPAAASPLPESADCGRCGPPPPSSCGAPSPRV